MEDEEDLRYGMRCRYHRQEVLELEPGGRVIRTLVRTDGLKHRNVTCAFVLHRDQAAAADAGDEATSWGLNGTLIVRCFGVCCECSLTIRIRLRLLIGSVTVRTKPWQEGIRIGDDVPAVRFNELFQLGDFETASAGRDALLEVRLLFEITSASPSFLMAPRVPTFQPTALCDEEKEMATLACSDGSLCAERTLLMRESGRWKSRLSDPEEAQTPLDCSEFSAQDMKVFLFYLQTQLFFELARFDTFNMISRIAVRLSVSSVVRRCANFVNDCVLLAEAGRKSAEASGASVSAASPPAESPVSSKVRWTPEDLVQIWCTTVNHLGEDSLGRAVMRLICQSSYPDIARLTAFKQLDTTTKSSFYHHFLLCREGTGNSQVTDANPAASGGGAP